MNYGKHTRAREAAHTDEKNQLEQQIANRTKGKPKCV